MIYAALCVLIVAAGGFAAVHLFDYLDRRKKR
jgi:hypothetical protein